VLTGQAPPNSTHFAANAPFTANWTVKNTGDQTWLATSVDVTYSSGANLSSAPLYDTTSDVNVGSSTTLSVPMKAPASPGTYTTTWSLRVSSTLFCSMSLTIIVP
jgi:hypothetical protein